MTLQHIVEDFGFHRFTSRHLLRLFSFFHCFNFSNTDDVIASSDRGLTTIVHKLFPFKKQAGVMPYCRETRETELPGCMDRATKRDFLRQYNGVASARQ